MREGSNLVYSADITLSQSLNRCYLTVPTIGGRTVYIACPEVIHPKYERKVSGEGMPSPGNLSKRGDLIIRFNIKFPNLIKHNIKKALRELLR